MNINRHNYEEFFILYMDNELSDADRRMVEDFAQHNPDLKEELDILLQSKLVPDNSVVFEDKNELLKMEENTGISLSNYEEWLTLYIDGELSSTEKMEVEKFALQNPSIQAELEIFYKTKFSPEEEVVFPNKESLYRETEKVRVIPVRWWRSAAAILILALGLTSVFIFNKKSAKNPDNSIVSGKKIPATIHANNVKKEIITNQPEIASNNSQKETNNLQKAVKRNSEQKNKENTNPIADVSNKSNDVASLQLKKDKTTILETPLTNNLPSSINNPNAKIQASTDPVVAINPSNKNITNSQIDNNPVTEKKIQTSIQQTGPEYASMDEGDNKKTRGFFRKVVRLLSKKTGIDPTDNNDRLMVANVNVKLR